MKKLFLWILLALPACQHTTNIGQEPVALHQLIDDWHERGAFDGSVMVWKNGKPYFQKAIGLANRSWQLPVALDTKFDIASISKSMTALLVLQLAAEGKLSLEDTLSAHLPEFKSTDKEGVTIHQMLIHTSAIGNYEHVPNESLRDDNWKRFKRLHFSRSEMVGFIKNIPLVAVPGQSMNYSNFAYFLLMHMVERIEGQHISEVLQRRIFEPLDMKNSLVREHNEQIIEELADGYNWQEDKGLYWKNEYIDGTLRIPIISTIEDICKWGYACGTGKLLPPEYHTLMVTNHLANMNATYGYGWAVHPAESTYVMGNLQLPEAPYIVHGGAMEGYRSMLCVINKGEWVIAHLSNIGDKTNEIGLSREIIKLLYHRDN